MDREVKDVQLGLMQFVNHEADDFLAVLGHHANAIALAQTAQEILLGPGVFETLLFRLEDFGHVAANHPADMDASLFFFRTTRAHDGLLPGTAREAAPILGALHHASAPVPIGTGNDRKVRRGVHGMDPWPLSDKAMSDTTAGY
jgi:hypothetical protein